MNDSTTYKMRCKMPPKNLSDAKELDNGIMGVYAIFLRHDPKKAYIGSSKDIRKRLMSHLSRLKSGKHKNYRLKGLFKYHGIEAFKFVILETCECENKMRQREQNILDFVDDKDLYNIDNRVFNYKRKK